MLLYEKLSAIEKRVGEIETDLGKPDATKDQNRFQSLSRELARLRPLIAIFRQYKEVERELKDLDSLLQDPKTEPEIRQISDE